MKKEQEYIDKEFLDKYVKEIKEDEIKEALRAQSMQYYALKAFEVIIQNGLVKDMATEEQKKNPAFLNGMLEGFKIAWSMCSNDIPTRDFVLDAERYVEENTAK